MSDRPRLSLILCSRNDAYMGNARWRLETTLNYLGERVAALDKTDEVDVLVADWGSDTPLCDVVTLTRTAARIVSFVTVPPPVARERQRDSPFPEVLALNTAARRATGEYIGRIDQDTLVGDRFLRQFFEWVDGRGPDGFPLEKTLLFANRRSVPYRFAVRSPELAHVTRFVRLFGRHLPIWRQNTTTGDVFWTSYVGLWLAHRDVWHECGGYDERLIYYNWMETDMICRLRQQYPVVDGGELTAYDFYHLEHYPPRSTWQARPHALKNADMDLRRPPELLHPNSDAWGLADLDLAVERCRSLTGAREPTAAAQPQPPNVSFLWLMTRVIAGMAADRVVIAARAGLDPLRRRLRHVRAELGGHV